LLSCPKDLLVVVERRKLTVQKNTAKAESFFDRIIIVISCQGPAGDGRGEEGEGGD